MVIQKAYDSVDWKALREILKEVGFLKKFVDWIMQKGMTVSYQFNINVAYTSEMQAKRDLR